MAKKAKSGSGKQKRTVSGKRGSPSPQKKRAGMGTDLRGVIGIIVTCLGLLALASQFIKSNGGFLKGCNDLVRGLGGSLCLLLPIVVCAGGVALVFSRERQISGRTILCSALLFLFIEALLQLFQVDAICTTLLADGLPASYVNFLRRSYQASTQDWSKGGGLLGALLAWPLVQALDVWGSVVVLVFACVVVLIILTGVSTGRIGMVLSGWFEDVRETLNERREEKAALRAAHEEEELERQNELAERRQQKRAEREQARQEAERQKLEQAERNDEAAEKPESKPHRKKVDSNATTAGRIEQQVSQGFIEGVNSASVAQQRKPPADWQESSKPYLRPMRTLSETPLYIERDDEFERYDIEEHQEKRTRRAANSALADNKYDENQTENLHSVTFSGYDQAAHTNPARQRTSTSWVDYNGLRSYEFTPSQMRGDAQDTCTLDSQPSENTEGQHDRQDDGGMNNPSRETYRASIDVDRQTELAEMASEEGVISQDVTANAENYGGFVHSDTHNEIPDDVFGPTDDDEITLRDTDDDDMDARLTEGENTWTVRDGQRADAREVESKETDFKDSRAQNMDDDHNEEHADNDPFVETNGENDSFEIRNDRQDDEKEDLPEDDEDFGDLTSKDAVELGTHAAGSHAFGASVPSSIPALPLQRPKHSNGWATQEEHDEEDTVMLRGTRLDGTPLVMPKKDEHESPKPVEEYAYPPLDLLNRSENVQDVNQRAKDEASAAKLMETLASFGVQAKLTHVTHGPAITRYELQPAPGVKVSRIVSLVDDIALNMASDGVRIEAPIPGKPAVGIEIPNEKIEMVSLRDVLESAEMQRQNSSTAVALGKSISGTPVIADVAKMPHVLIAGATGSGKSVCINTIINSIIYRASPREVRLILIDPKVVELSVYNGIPHLLVPVVTDPKKASAALSWAVVEMEHRYKRFESMEVRNIEGYNRAIGPNEEPMSKIIVIIDELADLMMVAPGEVEESICRLAQLARAAGIHLVIATQRPSVNVITGIIKANIPSRIAFAVSSQIDSRTILDSNGAEKLLGKGDMLYAPQGASKPTRVQGCFVSDEEVQRIVDYVRGQHKVEYNEDVIEQMDSAVSEDKSSGSEMPGDEGEQVDEMLHKAIELAVEAGQISISMLQRRLRIGYARAGRLVDEMTQQGIIAEAEGPTKPRAVLISREEWNRMQENER